MMLIKSKTYRVTCNNWCFKVQKHAWFSCYSCWSWHKSQKCKIFVHTFCHKMHDFTPTMPSIGRHIPFIFCARKFHIHYRLNNQNRLNTFWDIWKNARGDLLFWLSVYMYIYVIVVFFTSFTIWSDATRKKAWIYAMPVFFSLAL